MGTLCSHTCVCVLTRCIRNVCFLTYIFCLYSWHCSSDTPLLLPRTPFISYLHIFIFFSRYPFLLSDGGHTNSMREQFQQPTTRSQTKSQRIGVIDLTAQSPMQERSGQKSRLRSLSKNAKYADSDRLAPPPPAKKGSSAAGSVTVNRNRVRK